MELLSRLISQYIAMETDMAKGELIFLKSEKDVW